MTDAFRDKPAHSPAEIIAFDADALVLLFSRAGRRIRVGSLSVVTPSGARLLFRGAAPGPAARIVIHRWRALGSIAVRAGIGLGQSYARGEWDSPNLPALVAFLIANIQRGAAPTLAARLTRRVRKMIASIRPNTRTGSRRKVAYHYDIGNDFYRAWLDPSLTYSAAMFDRPGITLEQAQFAKYKRIAEGLSLSRGDHVLEIGCGWGGFAMYVAKELGVRVTGITLSEEQFRLATQRAGEAGLDNLVRFELRDYRDLRGQYSHIVSIEMLEAVGEAYWPTYFETLSRVLRPGGRAAIQCIVIDPAAYGDYRVGSDFIQSCIFPGGMLPTKEIIAAQAKWAGLLQCKDSYFGMHYANTLSIWRQNFGAATETLAAQGFDDYFRRLWIFYLAYCEGGFLTQRVDVGQWIFEKPLSEPFMQRHSL